MSSKPFDASMKDLLEVEPAAWPALLGPWAALKVEAVDADVSTVTAAADKVLRIICATYAWLLHLDFQSTHELGLPQRVHWYNGLLYERHRLLVRSIVVLLRPKAEASSLTGETRLQFPDEAVPYDVFRYRVVRLWQMPLELLLGSGLGTLPLAALTDEAAPDLTAVLSRIERRLQAEASPGEAEKLRSVTYMLLGLRYDEQQTIEAYKGVFPMFEKVLQDSATYQGIIARGMAQGVTEGIAQGRTEGIAQGRTEGMAQGALAEAKKVLMRLGLKKFGPVDPETQAAVAAIDDLGRIEELSERLLFSSSWQDLLAGDNG